MRGVTTALITGLLAISACAAAAATPFAVTSQHALVRADPEVQTKAARVAALVDEGVARIGPMLGAEDLGPIPVIVYADRKAMLSAAGLPARSGIVGFASLPAGVIHVDGAERLASIEKVMPHEVAHVLTARAVGPALPAVPLWLNEGIAEYAAGTTASQVDPAWVRALARGKSLRLDELDGAIARHGDDAGLAYAQAASLVHFLVAQRGEGVIRDLLRAIARSHDFEASLLQTTGWRPAEMDAAWRAATVRRWRWPVVFEMQGIWLLLMLALFLAGLVRHLRERRRRQEAAEEDS